MRVHKRRKSSRWRGSHTHGRGFKKKARGSGHRGGVGMAGTGKRGDQRKTYVLNLYGNDYFGKDKTLRKGHQAPKLGSINLRDIELNLQSFIKQGVAKESKTTKGSYEVNLVGYKILGEGNLISKLTIKASAASKSAIEQVKKSGSQIVLLEKKEIKTPVKEEKKEAVPSASPSAVKTKSSQSK